MTCESDNIGSFLRELPRIPALTDDEERVLRGLIRAGDERARQRLIEGPCSSPSAWRADKPGKRPGGTFTTSSPRPIRRGRGWVAASIPTWPD
jgi:hypothetical protein